MKSTNSMKPVLLGMMLLAPALALSQQTPERPRQTQSPETEQVPLRAQGAESPARSTLDPARPIAPASQVNLQQERRGGSEGNGGDGVYEDGALILRDLSRNNQLEVVVNNKTYLESHTGFMNLLRELAEVSPYLAMQTWDDLVAAQIWLTREPLPVLPAAATGVTRRNAEVQVAIRTGRQIIISLHALEQLRSPFEYVLLHEALHGILRTNSAMGHETVRAFVRFISDHRGRFNREDLKSIGRTLGVPTVGAYEDTKIWRSELRGLVLNQLFITDGGRSPDVCKLYGNFKRIERDRGPTLTYVSSTWGQLANCPSQTLTMAEVVGLFPELRTRRRISYPYVYALTFNDRRSNRPYHLTMCKEKADPAILRGLEADLAEVRRLEGVKANLTAQYADRTDKEAIMALMYLALMEPHSDYGFSWGDSATTLKQDLASSSATARTNIASCTALFGANYMNRSRP
jgi:hypothetical protein